jgi:hypothetical protein
MEEETVYTEAPFLGTLRGTTYESRHCLPYRQLSASKCEQIGEGSHDEDVRTGEGDIAQVVGGVGTIWIGSEQYSRECHF